MQNYWAQSTAGFYSDEEHGENIPQDKIAITPEEKAALLTAQGQGKNITVVNGAVVALDPPGPSPEQAWANLRIRRDRLLTASDWTVGNDTPLTADEVASWKTYRQALRDLPANTPDPLTPVWPAIPA